MLNENKYKTFYIKRLVVGGKRMSTKLCIESFYISTNYVHINTNIVYRNCKNIFHSLESRQRYRNSKI